MQGHDGLESGQPRRYHLGSTTEACKEMGLDKTRGDFEIGFHPSSIQQDTHTRAGSADIHKRSTVAGVMTDDAACPRKLGSDHFLDLGVAVSPMRSRRDEDRHIFAPNSGHLPKQRLKHQLSRLSARNIADRDSNFLTRLHKLPQRAPADWCRNRLPQCFGRIRRRRNMNRFDYRGPVCRKVNRQPIASIIEFYFHADLNNTD